MSPDFNFNAHITVTAYDALGSKREGRVEISDYHSSKEFSRAVLVVLAVLGCIPLEWIENESTILERKETTLK